MDHFFPRIQVQICAQVHTRVKLLEGMQMKTILKLLGGIQSNYWGDISPYPPGFRHPWPPQTAFFLAAVSRRWLLFSWDQQRTRRKVDQFGALTFFFEISRELEVKQTTPIWRDSLSFFFFLRSTENLELCRA